MTIGIWSEMRLEYLDKCLMCSDAPLRDRHLGLINNLSDGIDPAACSDLVLICEKPYA
jgi:hypothetical protein